MNQKIIRHDCEAIITRTGVVAGTFPSRDLAVAFAKAEMLRVKGLEIHVERVEVFENRHKVRFHWSPPKPDPLAIPAIPELARA